MLNFFSELSFGVQALVIFFLLINVITFLFFGMDKFKANKDFRRIPEKTLWILSACGGTIGALLGMKVFRHKTKKTSFQAVFFLILFLQIALLFFFFSLAPSSQVNF